MHSRAPPMHKLPVMSMVMVLTTASVGAAQFADESTKGARLDKELTERWEIGLVVTAASGPCAGFMATVALPVDWPEQQVKVISEEFSPFVTSHAERMV